ncbi:phosphatidylinositol 3,4,5-trisphosphate 3-phosphatase TPTE2-like [Ylistrum balloti]|uniref:phosphatidylinositol 3,4,5-trisphosphate 3-phosphatase TPTE2-like n=1 Tax=Ylistrum balloti TaxID=509963 RepID=UPI0029059CE9|nr:phosphatidylinositol 3,4,5-trisphosphate 3-phosphatase TPTE2-like [Ylistrum balloti]
MSNYERFDSDRGEPEGAAEIDVTRVESREIQDTHIQVDNPVDKGQVKFYESDNKPGLEYIEDPAQKVQLTGLKLIQSKFKAVIENVIFRIITVLLILLDFVLTIIGLAETDNASSGLEIVSHCIITYFLLEVAARIFYQERLFFTSILDMIDGGVVVVSFILDMVFIALSTNDPDMDYLRLVVIGRVVRIIRALRIIYLMVQQQRHVATASRRVVSQNKRRYQKNGFDLDLCYITERVIAMSFPSKGMMAMYRNPVREVARFFDEKHKDHYRIYNLCSERDYDEELFHNRVERVFIDDHNVPRLSEMVDFCANAREFMNEDTQNVIAIHCKGGKGRTGTMICTWLIDCGLFEDAEESLGYFGDRRTDLTVGKTFQGVETPSQSRYVGYYEKVKKDLEGQLPPRKEKKMTSVKIEGLTGVGNGDGSDFSMEIRVDGLLIYECRFGDNINCQMMKYTDSDSIVVNLQNSPTLFADVKLRFFSSAKNIPKIYDNCAFFLWFHTSFIESNKLRLTRDEIDNPHKKKAKEVYRDNFAVELNFEDADED